MSLKILTVDVETAPSLAYIWRMWQEDINLDRLIASGHMLCWAAAWDGKSVQFRDKRDPDMYEKIHELMSEADAIVHYNGNRFDIPVLNRELLLQGMSPPAPSRQIDLYQVVKRKFRFASNKLDHVVQQLGIGSKLKHAGFQTWVGAMTDDEKAWRDMKRYNIADVKITQALYRRLLPWIDGHPNRNLHGGDGCPNCGSANLRKEGITRTLTREYQRWQCKDCGRWSRSTKSVPGSGVDIQGAD